jgi:hypothetical protein
VREPIASDSSRTCQSESNAAATTSHSRCYRHSVVISLRGTSPGPVRPHSGSTLQIVRMWMSTSIGGAYTALSQAMTERRHSLIATTEGLGYVSRSWSSLPVVYASFQAGQLGDVLREEVAGIPGAWCEGPCLRPVDPYTDWRAELGCSRGSEELCVRLVQRCGQFADDRRYPFVAATKCGNACGTVPSRFGSEPY